jgi:hypothetical protein
MFNRKKIKKKDRMVCMMARVARPSGFPGKFPDFASFSRYPGKLPDFESFSGFFRFLNIFYMMNFVSVVHLYLKKFK